MYGQNRKQEVQSSLSGAAAPQPIMIDGPGVGGANNAVNFQPAQGASGMDIELASQLGNYVQGELAKAVKLKQEKSMMDGQMANHQGTSFDQIQTDGDKWAMEGYRMVEARELASGLYIAQQQEIATGAYQDDPDAYRERMSTRMSEMVASAPDARTAELARQTFMEQTPGLLDNQLIQHMEYKERQNFETLQRSVHTISLDPTATDDLLSFAMGGEGSATASLSDERRREATVSGVELAFANDNPLAYATLSRNGLLGDNLTTEQKQRVDSARKAYENRKRQEYDAEMFQAEQDLITKVESGDMQPMEAVDALSDLYAEHGIEISKREAGAIYIQAQNGVHTTQVTNGLLIEEAGMRGDIDTQAKLISDSLESTESSGNPAAFRTNKDGRSYGGLLQFGDDRLSEYAAATGTNPMTARQFSQLSREQQAVVNQWHVKDIINTINTEFPDVLGTQINGVTVTLSGLVAVAHLGGKDGMRKFIRTNGASSPSDELGTSLTDYLDKHGTGERVENMGPQQRIEYAQNLRNQTAERMQLEQRALIEPMLTEADALYTNDVIGKDEWQTRRQNAFDAYGVYRSNADISHEIKLSNQAVENAVNNAVDEQERQNAIQYNLGVSEAEANYNAVTESYATGGASGQDVLKAREQFYTTMGTLQAQYGIKPTPDQFQAQVDRIVSTTDKATERARVYQEQGTEIRAAINSGSLSDLSPDLQNRAIKEKQAEIEKSVIDRFNNGEFGDGTDAQAQATLAVKDELYDFYAQAGVVDPQMERTMNGYLSQDMLSKDGQPNEGYVEAVQDYMALRDRNPALADRYVRDENRANLDAVIGNAGSGNVTGAVQTIGSRQGNSRFAKSYEDIITDPRVYSSMSDSVDKYMKSSDIGIAQALFSSTADFSQVNDQTNKGLFAQNRDEVRTALMDTLKDELMTTHAHNPRLFPSELVAEATRRMDQRTAIVNGDVFYIPPSAGTTVDEYMFGQSARTGDFNSALIDWVKSEDFNEYSMQTIGRTIDQSVTLSERLPNWMPFGGNEEIGRDAVAFYADTGVRPYSVHWAGNQMVMNIYTNDGNTVVLPVPQDKAREIGRMYSAVNGE